MKTFIEYPIGFTAAELLGLTEDDLQIMEQGDVVVPVKRCAVKNGGRSIVVHCPFCGHEHTHSGGLVSEKPCLGHRLPHCAVKTEAASDGYFIADPTGKCKGAV